MKTSVVISALLSFVALAASTSALALQPGDPRPSVPPLVKVGQSDFQRAETLFWNGEFDHAAKIAVSVGSPPGFALAARATLAHAEFSRPHHDRLALYREAEAHAARAMVLDPNYAEAYRYRAMALGYIGLTLSPLEAYAEGLADEAILLINRALVLEPADPWVYAILGAWHAEIVAAAGPFFARTLFDASEGQAHWAFKKAISLEPRNLVVHYQYALILDRLAEEENDSVMIERLKSVVRLQASNKLEELVQQQANAMLARVMAAKGPHKPS